MPYASLWLTCVDAVVDARIALAYRPSGPSGPTFWCHPFLQGLLIAGSMRLLPTSARVRQPKHVEVQDNNPTLAGNSPTDFGTAS